MIKDIRNVTSTRKFWVGLLGAVVSAVLVYLADTPEFAPVVSLLSAIGVYQVRNA